MSYKTLFFLLCLFSPLSHANETSAPPIQLATLQIGLLKISRSSPYPASCGSIVASLNKFQGLREKIIPLTTSGNKSLL